MTGAYIALYPYLPKRNTGSGKRIRTDRKPELTRAITNTRNPPYFALGLSSEVGPPHTFLHRIINRCNRTESRPMNHSTHHSDTSYDNRQRFARAGEET